MKRKNAPDVDITPLLDMMFILIIFFVITTSFLKGEVSVDLPSGHGARMEGEVAILNVAPDGELSLDGTTVASADLPLLAKKAESMGRKFVIAGDKEARYGVIAEILGLLRREGLPTATLAIEIE